MEPFDKTLLCRFTFAGAHNRDTLQNPDQAQAKSLFQLAPDIRSGNPADALSPKVLFIGLFCYFALQVLLRVLCSTSVDLDESEQVVLCQKFCWGYGSDPPLYTWIQMPFFWVFGQSVLGLSLLKNLLLFSTYALTYAATRLLTRNRMAAIAAMLSLLYLPGVAWESQRDLTHSIFAGALSLAMLCCVLQLLRQRRTAWYWWLGVSAGAGLLAKYNYAFWLLGLFLAALSLSEARSVLLDKRILLSLGTCLVIFLPNGLWMLNHRDLALLTASKFDVRQSFAWVRVTLLGTKNLLLAVVEFALPLLVIYWLLFRRALASRVLENAPGGATGPTGHVGLRRNPVGRVPPRGILSAFQQPASQSEPSETDRNWLELIVRAWAVILGILFLLVLLAHSTGFKDRWFQPILTALPVVAAALVETRLTSKRLYWMCGISTAVMVAVAIALPGRLLVAERLHREEPLTRPYAQLAGQIAPLIPGNSLVICDTRLLAGNLRLGLPNALVLPPELSPLMKTRQAHCLLVWDATRDEAPPPALLAWRMQFAPQASGDIGPRFFSATYRFHKSKQYCLGLLQLF